MITEYHPYKLYDSNHLVAISNHLSDVIARWGEKWIIGKEVNISKLDEYNNQQVDNPEQIHKYLVTTMSDDSWSAVYIKDNDRRTLGLSICGIAYMTRQIIDGAIATAVVHDAINDLGARLVLQDSNDYLDTNTKEVPQYALNPGSGCLHAVVNVGKYVLQVILSEGICRKMTGDNRESRIYTDQYKTVSTISAIMNAFVNVDIILGAVELDVRSFVNLNVGDVIEIDKSLSEPCDVYISGNTTNIGGYLGRANNIAAARLISK